MLSKNQLSKIGIGTWGIGGYAEPDVNNDDKKQIQAMIYAMNHGINYIETVYMYAKGKTVELVAEALKKSGINREKMFITLSVYTSTAQNAIDAENEVERFLKQCRIDYIDSLQFTMSGLRLFGINKVQALVDKLIKQGKTRFTNLTNSNLDYLKQYHEIFKDKLFAHEGCYNFEVRENEKYGITTYCQNNNILNVIFQPLRRNRTANRNWSLLVELSKKYGKTQNQILLNWISAKGFLPLNKSSDIHHIDENLQAFEFSLEKADYDTINNFVIPKYDSPKIDWLETGDGIKIHQLPNVFDDIYKG